MGVCVCGQDHKLDKDDCIFAKECESWGASVAWANDPDYMQHQITFTPAELRNWLKDNK